MSTEGISSAALEWPVVQTDAGPVTLANVGDLRARAAQWREWAEESKAKAQSLRSQAEDRYAAAGAVLVAHAAEWMAPSELGAALAEASALTGRVAADDQSAASLKDQESSANLFGRIAVRRHERHVEQDRTQTEVRLRGLRILIARSAPAITIGEADDQRKAAAELDSQAAAVDGEIQSAEGWASACDAEVTRRDDAIKAMGFDSLYEAAVLQTSGAPRVDAPIVLKRHEEAYLAEPATLARMVSRTHYVGGSSGFSFPIGHTGIRYRVGGFRAQPVRQDSLSKLDTGTFVVTNMRIVYIGRTKSTSLTLEKLLHVEVYSDGISVSREGREKPDFYLMNNPKHAVFLLNWALSQRAAVG